MKKLKDFKCPYADYSGMDPELAASLNLTIPELYQNSRDMAVYAKAVRKREGTIYCKVPFDTSAEGEALGAILKYDRSPLGPRKDGDTLQDPREILELPQLDPGKGRISEILRACDVLRAEGEAAAVEVRGLFDIANTLLDIQKFLMLWVTGPDTMQKICDKIRADLIRYVAEAKKHCDLLFYSDASGGINVIGPRLAKQLVTWFTEPLMKDLQQVLEGGPALQMCPKTAFMLVGAKKAEYRRYETGERKTYAEICLNPPEGIRFLGQRCNRNLSKGVKGHMDYLALL